MWGNPEWVSCSFADIRMTSATSYTRATGASAPRSIHREGITLDAIQILGDLLGNRHVSRGRGSNILESILGGAGARGQRPARQSTRSHAHGRSVNQSPLGGLIRAAVDQYGRHQSERRAKDHHEDRHGHDHARSRAPSRDWDQHRGYDERRIVQRIPNAGDCRFPNDRGSANEQAQLLIRAMIYASQADGYLDPREQNNIVSRMGYLSPQEKQFLQHEFQRRIDICDFAREVPPGLEDEVYAISLTAIDLDTNKEARYLHDLAHELDLSHQEVNYIHQQVGVRPLF